MAAAIGADADIADIRIGWLGAFNEPANNVIAVDGAATDADLEQFLDDVDAVSNAGMPSVSVAARRLVTGVSTTPAFASALAKVNDMFVLTFSQPHPLNAAKTITKTVQIRAPRTEVIGTNGVPVVASVVGDRSSPDESLRGIINFLEDNLVYVAVDDTVTVGGWTWDASRSAYVSAPAVIDGA